MFESLTRNAETHIFCSFLALLNDIFDRLEDARRAHIRPVRTRRTLLLHGCRHVHNLIA